MGRVWFKLADAIGSGTADPSTAPARQSPVPQLSVENKPAPGQRGPRGLAGRTTYSRVNTGIPPIPDAGAMAQKSQAPRGLEFLPKMASESLTMESSLMARPSLQELIKAAMEGSAAKVSVSLEAARQISNTGGTPPQQVKTASATTPEVEHIPTELITKLAAAAQYTASQLIKAADTTNIPLGDTKIGPGSGATSLSVSSPSGAGTPAEANASKATSQNQVPISPPQQKDPTRPVDSGTGLQTNDSSMPPPAPVEPIANEKAPLGNDKTGSAQATYLNNLLSMGLLKVASTPNGLVFVPSEKVALLVDPVGATYGITQAPPGRMMEGAARGSLGAGMGGAAGALGGGTLGALGGGALGALGGGLAGAALGAPGAGAATGAALGGALGGGAGALGGGLYGRQKGYQATMRPLLQQQGAAQAAQPIPEEATKGAAARLVGRVKVAAGPEDAAAQEAAINAALNEYGQAAKPAMLGILGGGTLGAVGGGLAGSALGDYLGRGLYPVSRGLASGTGALVGLAGGAALGGYGGGRLGLKMTDQGRLHAAEEQLRAADPSAFGPAKMASVIEERVKAATAAKDAVALAKLAYAKNLLSLGLLKEAEDAINPAQISTPKSDDNGPNNPRGAAPTGEGVPPEPSDVTSQKSKMLSSNEAAINYTKRDAKADPKSDLADVLTEPALSSATDNVLNQAFAHTQEAGAKISSAQLTQIAGARAVLAKLAAATGATKKNDNATTA